MSNMYHSSYMISKLNLRRTNLSKIWKSASYVTGIIHNTRFSSTFTAPNIVIEPLADESNVIDSFQPHKYKSFFEINKATSIYDVKEGGYVNISDDLVKKYFPEGLSGEMDEEFEYSDSKTWMMRDSSKLICKLLDEYINIQNNPKSTQFEISDASLTKVNSSKQVHEASLTLNGLTDRDPLRNTVLQAQHYGKELLVKFDALKKLRGNPPPHQEGKINLINDYLKKIKESHKNSLPSKILIGGSEGVGKSVTLNQVVLHARQNNWLCLFIPNGWRHSQEGWYIEPVILNNGQKIFDNSFMSADVLRGFLKAHSSSLQKFPIKLKQNLTKYQSTIDTFKEERLRSLSVKGRDKFSFIQIRSIIEGEDNVPEQDTLDEPILKEFSFVDFKFETLGDLVTFGIAFRDRAGLVFIDLVNELKLIEQVPVLIAIDNYNVWEVPSAFFYEQKPVHARELCVPYALQILTTKKAESISWELKNGMCVCATSARYSEGRNVTYEDYKGSIPFKINVPSYTQIEYFASIMHYMNSLKIHETTTMQEILGFRIHTASNPKLMRKEAIPYFLPLAMETDEPDFMMSAYKYEDDDLADESSVNNSSFGGYDDTSASDSNNSEDSIETSKTSVTKKSFNKKK